MKRLLAYIMLGFSILFILVVHIVHIKRKDNFNKKEAKDVKEKIGNTRNRINNFLRKHPTEKLL